jgi:APA family basic amino acid/polyamine antiporter
LMEYAIGNIAVAISWSDYFTSFCTGLNLHFPSYLTMDYFSAYQSSVKAVTPNTQATEAAMAWATAPVVGGIKVIFDLPALLINILITAVVYIGINESKKLANALVVIKLVVIVMIIIIGFYYVNPQNWIPFAPNGFSGVFQGVSAVFFAYIGFDAISTTSEECINPQKDLPKSMMYALAICTILYVLITLVLTGMVSYTELNVGDPLSYVFSVHGLNFLSGVIALSAIVSLASVLLVFQLGQPRIWMSMSRDGLLPGIFGVLSKRFKTPWFSTLVTGVVVAVPTMFMNLTQVTDLCSIGTLFAFLLVCAGVLVKKTSTNPQAFKITYINSRWIAAAVTICIYSLYIYYDSEIWVWNVEHLPIYIFLLVIVGVSIWAFVKQLSLIPVMGVFINLYLMSQLGLTNWLRFGIWLLIGLVIYFSYGIRKSKLNEVEER